MRKYLFILMASLLTGCSGGDFIRSRAEHFVRSTYPDVDRILHYSVDTITLGDNMNYRIEQSKENLKHAEFNLEYSERSAERNRRGGLMSVYASDTARVRQNREEVARQTARLQALDSLLANTAQDVLDAPAAYQCCIAYNTPDNLVWLQLDPYGNLLVISKDILKLYYNPGGDVPGYLEVNDRFRKY